MKRDLEYKFFKEFQYDGAAIMTLDMMHFEHCNIGNGTAGRKDYPDGVLAEIRERTESFNTWPWGGVENCSPLMDEIADNLMTMQLDCRQMYAEELIFKMQRWTWLYSLSKEKLDAVSNSVVEFSVEMYFHEWRSAFQTFAEKLAVILAKLKINILDIQNRCGITLIERLDVKELWTCFGSYELAEYYLSKINTPHKENKAKARKAGRPKSTENPFADKLIGSDEEKKETLKRLHQLLDGKTGKFVALVIFGCIKAGKLSMPTFPQLQVEFNVVGCRQAFQNYNASSFSDFELNAMVEKFKM